MADCARVRADGRSRATAWQAPSSSLTPNHREMGERRDLRPLKHDWRALRPVRHARSRPHWPALPPGLGPRVPQLQTAVWSLWKPISWCSPARAAALFAAPPQLCNRFGWPLVPRAVVGANLVAGAPTVWRLYSRAAQSVLHPHRGFSQRGGSWLTRLAAAFWVSFGAHHAPRTSVRSSGSGRPVSLTVLGRRKSRSLWPRNTAISSRAWA